MVKIFSPNSWQMMTFLSPLDALIPKIPLDFWNCPFSFFADFGSGSPARPGGHSVGFWGSRQLSLFWGGGACQGALSTPPPPIESPAALVISCATALFVQGFPEPVCLPLLRCNGQRPPQAVRTMVRLTRPFFLPPVWRAASGLQQRVRCSLHFPLTCP